MKDNLVITTGDAQVLQHNLHVLAACVQELKKVMGITAPPGITATNIDAALQKFTGTVNNTGAIRLTYQPLQLNNGDISSNAATFIYTAIQELVINILKHSNAKNAGITVSKKTAAVTITVKDDGQGFDTAILGATKGNGYKEMGKDIAGMGGTLRIDAKPAKGTLVTITIPLTGLM